MFWAHCLHDKGPGTADGDEEYDAATAAAAAAAVAWLYTYAAVEGCRDEEAMLCWDNVGSAAGYGAVSRVVEFVG